MSEQGDPVYLISRAELLKLLRGAVDLTIEYRDQHGRTEAVAIEHGIYETADGIDAIVELSAEGECAPAIRRGDAYDDLLSACELRLGLEDDRRPAGSLEQRRSYQRDYHAVLERMRAAVALANSLALAK